MTIHVTDAELARDVRAVLAKVRQGAEIVIEQDSRPVAVLKPPQVKGRRISEVIAALETSGANAVVDDDFERDVEAGIHAYREPWNHGQRAALQKDPRSERYSPLAALSRPDYSAATSRGTCWYRDFQYDQFGNMVTDSPGFPLAGNTPHSSSSYNSANNQIDIIGERYDATGNHITANGNTATYDAENPIISITQAPAFGGDETLGDSRDRPPVFRPDTENF